MSSAPARPRQPRQKPQAVADPTFSFEVDGKTYVVDALEISSLDELEILRVTGLTLDQVMPKAGSVEAAPKLVTIGVLMWVARRQAGENVALVDVLGSTNMRALQSLEFDDKQGKNPARPTEPAAS